MIVLGVDDVRVYGKPPERVEVLHRRLLLKWLQRFPVEAPGRDRQPRLRGGAPLGHVDGERLARVRNEPDKP